MTALVRTIGSLCSGIGALDLGVLWAMPEAEILWQVEKEPYCREVLRKHWPHAARHDDVVALDPHALAPVDLVVAGFPCQPASHAGKRAGTGDDRWLWPHLARVLRVVRPRAVLLENVPGLLTVDGGCAFGDVLADLDALGFDVRWTCLSAADVGAPHLRERLWITGVAHAHRDGQPQPAGGVGAEWGRPVDGREDVGDPGGERRASRIGVTDEGTHARGTRAGGRRAVAHADRRGGQRVRERGREVASVAAVGGAGGDAVGDPDRARRPGTDEGAAGAGRHAAVTAGTDGVADPDRPGLEGGLRERGDAHEERPPAQRGGARRESGPAQPRLGGEPARPAPGVDPGRWPAGRGAPQHDWEAPRTTRGIPHRSARVKALGNAVVPQCAHVIALALRRWMEHEGT